MALGAVYYLVRLYQMQGDLYSLLTFKLFSTKSFNLFIGLAEIVRHRGHIS